MLHKDKIITLAIAYVKGKLKGESSGHDWWHAYRVWKTAIKIAQAEGGDLFIIQLSALLHDIGDWKFYNEDDQKGLVEIKDWLEHKGVEKNIQSHVMEIIRDISFKGAGVASAMRTKEGMIVQDADRLDAIGAIGIARAFAYGGYKNREMHNPEINPQQHDTFMQYKNSRSTTINHFHEKLLLLKDLMNTQTARKMADERHGFMKDFLDRFFREWGSNINEEI